MAVSSVEVIVSNKLNTSPSEVLGDYWTRITSYGSITITDNDRNTVIIHTGNWPQLRDHIDAELALVERLRKGIDVEQMGELGE
jgi:hypothetical protein